MAQHSTAPHYIACCCRSEGQQGIFIASYVHFPFLSTLDEPLPTEAGWYGSFIPGQGTRPAYLEDLLHLTLAAEALPAGDHQKSCHLGIVCVSHSQCLVPAWAEP